jgi:uncharacterized protein
MLLIALPCAVLAMGASFLTKSTFKRYSRVRGSRGYTGAEAARIMLEKAGVYDCRIEPVNGFLSDHYDPRSRTLRLSEEVYGSRSLSAIGVACHEAGHALQHASNYAFLNFRSNLVPLTNLTSNLSTFVIMIGFFMNYNKTVMTIGCALLAVGVLFSLVTLPVEWDASARAKKAMVAAGVVNSQEAASAGSVLNAAFMTYLASAVTAIMTLLYYLMRSGLLGGRNDD